MKNSQHLGFWLALAVLGFLLSPLLRSGASIEQFVKHEIEITKSAMGERVGGMIVGFADELFTNTPLAAVANSAQSVQHSEADRRLSAKVAGPGGEIMSSMYNSYLQGLVMQAYVVAIRLAIVLFWLLFLSPVFVASVYDGLMQRHVKAAEFGSVRPATFTLAGMVVILVIALPVLYLVLPFSINPLYAPAWAAFVALPLSIMVSNMQPLFGR